MAATGSRSPASKACTCGYSEAYRDDRSVVGGITSCVAMPGGCEDTGGRVVSDRLTAGAVFTAEDAEGARKCGHKHLCACCAPCFPAVFFTMPDPSTTFVRHHVPVPTIRQPAPKSPAEAAAAQTAEQVPRGADQRIHL